MIINVSILIYVRIILFVIDGIVFGKCSHALQFVSDNNTLFINTYISYVVKQ
jgi:hypothetical protein